MVFQQNQANERGLTCLPVSLWEANGRRIPAAHCSHQQLWLTTIDQLTPKYFESFRSFTHRTVTTRRLSLRKKLVKGWWNYEPNAHLEVRKEQRPNGHRSAQALTGVEKRHRCVLFATGRRDRPSDHGSSAESNGIRMLRGLFVRYSFLFVSYPVRSFAGPAPLKRDLGQAACLFCHFGSTLCESPLSPVSNFVRIFSSIIKKMATNISLKSRPSTEEVTRFES